MAVKAIFSECSMSTGLDVAEEETKKPRGPIALSLKIPLFEFYWEEDDTEGVANVIRREVLIGQQI